jgi:hypothetical protein
MGKRSIRRVEDEDEADDITHGEEHNRESLQDLHGPTRASNPHPC